MDDGWPLVAAVSIGAIVLGSVLWSYLRQVPQQSVVLSTTLSLIGFTLVSSPLWGSIVVKGPQWEVALLKKQTVAQAQTFLDLAEAYQKRLPPQQATQIAPTVNELRTSVQDLKRTTDTVKKIDETLKIAEQLTLAVTKAVP